VACGVAVRWVKCTAAVHAVTVSVLEVRGWAVVVEVEVEEGEEEGRQRREGG
jgi:hypothetical protein